MLLSAAAVLCRFAEDETEALLTLPVGSDLLVNRLRVVAALGDRLRPALEAVVDLLDLGLCILPGVDPIELRRQPGVRDVLPPAGLIAGHASGAGRLGRDP